MSVGTSPWLGTWLCIAILSCALGCGENSTGLSGGDKQQSDKNKSDQTEARQTNDSNLEIGTEENSDTAGDQLADSTDDPYERIIPPEVITGAYLTCTYATVEAEDSFGYGCAVRDEDDNELSISEYKADWTLFANGAAIEEAVLHLVSGDSPFQVVWVIPNSYADQTFSAKLEMPQTNSPALAVPNRSEDKPIAAAPDGPILTVNFLP